MARKKVSLYVVTVQGKGKFPVDMLRYDNCWPRNSVDVTEMFGENREPRSAMVCSAEPPTKDRWASFGWIVTHVKEVS